MGKKLILEYWPSKAFYRKAFFRTVEPFEYEVNGETIVVQDNFLTDGASIPKVFRIFMPLWGKYGKAAVVHDWLCYKRKTPEERKYADVTFKAALEQEGVPKIVATLMFCSVRLFGMTIDRAYLALRAEGYL